MIWYRVELLWMWEVSCKANWRATLWKRSVVVHTQVWYSVNCWDYIIQSSFILHNLTLSDHNHLRLLAIIQFTNSLWFVYFYTVDIVESGDFKSPTICSEWRRNTFSSCYQKFPGGCNITIFSNLMYIKPFCTYLLTSAREELLFRPFYMTLGGLYYITITIRLTKE